MKFIYKVSDVLYDASHVSNQAVPGESVSNFPAPVVGDISKSPATFSILRGFPKPGLEILWRDLLSRVDLPSHYTSPEFFLEPYLSDKRPFAVLALQDESVIGVLTGVHTKNGVTCGSATRPQIQIDSMADPATVLEQLLAGLEEESRGAKLVSIYSWQWTPLDHAVQHGYRLRSMDGDSVLNLKVGAAALLKRVSKGRRAGIRHAIRNDVEIFQATTTGHYIAFYQIYSAWCAARGLTGFPYATEELAFRTTQSNRILFLASYRGKIIAGDVVRFLRDGLVECSRNCSLPEFLHLRPNDLLLWRSIEWACESGFPLLSMGASHRFLREYGGTTIPILRYRSDRTRLRHYDRREDLLDIGRELAHKLPPAWELRLRRFIGKLPPD